MSTRSSYQGMTRTRVKEPKRYNVIMHNDDFTTMEFVVEVLEDIFHKTAEEAERLMLLVHRTGSAVVGNYSYDIALTKVQTSLARAKAAGFPFKVTMEED